MVQTDIIEPAPVGELVAWCQPMVVVAKKGTLEPCITLNLNGPNKFRRPAYSVKVPREVFAGIPPGNNFSKPDGRHGYSKKLTAFINPWGSYHFCCNIMELISHKWWSHPRDKQSWEHFQRYHYLQHGPSQRCSSHGITLNAKKLVVAQSDLDWFGFRFSSGGHTPSSVTSFSPSYRRLSHSK